MTTSSLPRIVVYSHVHAFGGEERVLLGLAEYLHKQQLPYRVVCYDDTVGLSRFADFPLPLDVLNPGPGIIRKSRALARYLKTHTPHERVLLFGSQLAAHAALAGLTDFSVRIADPPSLLPASAKASNFLRHLKEQAVWWLVGRGLRSSASVITNADYLGHEISRLFNVDVLTIPVGGKKPPSTLSRARLCEHGKLRMLSVSRLEDNKRISWIIRTVAVLSDPGSDRSLPGVVLDIVGSGSEMVALQQLVGDLKLQDKVVFHGFVDDERLERLYAAADIFVMPALQGFGLPALEALYRELPVVMHRQSGVSGVLGENDWVELFDGGEAELVDALARMAGKVTANLLQPAALEKLPTLTSFSAAIVAHCGWGR